LQRFVDLGGGKILGAAIDLAHEKDLFAISIAHGLSHADLAGPTIVVPTVIHEGNASIDGAANEGDALLFIGLSADVIASQTDGGYPLTGAPKRAIGHPAVACPGRGQRSSPDHDSRRCRQFHEFASG
jgi:hypothetical protein